MKFLSAGKRIHQFSDMGLDPALQASLERLTITKPTDIQSQALPVSLGGQDLIAVAQTGSGKTLAFALPILNALKKKASARALVLVPTREMALQIYKVFEDLCLESPITSNVIIGGVRNNKHNSQLKKNPSLIIATPGRLNDLLRNNKLLLQGVGILVIDEADVMLDMGFVPQLKDIHATMRGNRQTMMFSASFNGKVEAIAHLFMKPDNTVMIRTKDTEKPVNSLTQKVMFMAPGMKNEQAQDEINAVKQSVIVFTANQISCETVGHYLKEYGHLSDFVHGGMNQSVRSRVLKNFREGKTRILVTTDLLSRGLDVPSVELVINFDLPPQPEDFIHRIGRTARMGRSGHSVTFVVPSDFKNYKQVKSLMVDAEEVFLDQNFKFIGDTTVKAKPSRLRPKRIDKATSNPDKKKKKYGTSNKKRRR